MFGFRKKNLELDELIAKVSNNLENNYKDEAQAAFKDFENSFKDLLENGKLNDKQVVYYKGKEEAFSSQLKNFTHKDQKVNW